MVRPIAGANKAMQGAAHRRRARFGRLAAILPAFAAILPGCSRDQNPATPLPSSQQTLVLFAAASTTELAGDLARRFGEQSGVIIQTNVAASATLARQIENGARCDLFLTADPRWIDELERQSLIEPTTRRALMENELVLVAPPGQRLEVAFDPAFNFTGKVQGRIAIGDPSLVPAGRYAQQALERLGWWSPLKPRLLPAADVRQALRLVERGEAAAGIVYRTDLTASRVELLGTFPAHLHDPIRYEIAACRSARPRAAEFLAFLSAAAGREMIRRHGFRPITPPATSAPQRLTTSATAHE